MDSPRGWFLGLLAGVGTVLLFPAVYACVAWVLLPSRDGSIAEIIFFWSFALLPAMMIGAVVGAAIIPRIFGWVGRSIIAAFGTGTIAALILVILWVTVGAIFSGNDGLINAPRENITFMIAFVLSGGSSTSVTWMLARWNAASG